MNEKVEAPDKKRIWTVQRLSGLSVTLEALMESQAILNEIIGYHAAFEQNKHLFTGRLQLRPEKVASLASQVQRLSELRDLTRKSFFELGKSLLWGGCAADDLEELYSQTPGLRMFGFNPPGGFDRGNMIKFGKELVSLLSRSKSVMAAVHLASADLRDSIVEAAASFDDSEKDVFEFLDSLAYWVFNDITRVRDLFRNYSAEIAILEEQENDKLRSKTE